MEQLKAKHGWMAIGATVLVHEALCARGELLSEGVDRAIEAHPLLTRAAIGVTALHLMNLIPDGLDPFSVVGRGLDRLKP